MTRDADGGGASPRCPTCSQPVAWRANPARPFCSVGCQLVDLGAWLDEAYRIPGSDRPPAAGPTPERAGAATPPA